MIKEEMTKIQMAIMILIDLYFTIHLGKINDFKISLNFIMPLNNDL